MTAITLRDVRNGIIHTHTRIAATIIISNLNIDQNSLQLVNAKLNDVP